MFKKWLKRGPREVVAVAPVQGRVVALEEVPDPVFAEKMMGDGVAVEPQEGILCAPVDGEVVQLFPTHHAIGIRSAEGLEWLLHIGLETVSMEGEGFSARVKVGDQVKAGDRLIEFSLDRVKEKAKSTITPIIITNMDKVNKLETHIKDEVQTGDIILTCTISF
ncbi:PTS sugar transporter subunit IIA [Desmospora profundinema]|uniref:PTS system glucose-specific IIA component n=1 Tax=Desmospora profundinema TaxID=1571184 RepID=A0ABU1IM08_9BACL|nr:PTS glucose transporter subunit IIA [Desmospora profundinema]MDR6225726.1 PTS system glucose-specific IIA component [Desmospora profundinema]